MPDDRNRCGFRLHWEERLPIEDWNAHVSLLVGMGAAEQMLAHGLGLLRVMDTPDPERLAAARAAAAKLQGVAALTAMRHAMGRARYAFFDGAPPAEATHYALAAPYAHVTAPMRRLCDRYVLELLADGPDAELRDALARLPETMARAEARAGRLERELIDATEACLLAGRIGERFTAVVLSSDDRGAQIQIEEPPVIARLDAPADAWRGARGDAGSCRSGNAGDHVSSWCSSSNMIQPIQQLQVRRSSRVPLRSYRLRRSGSPSPSPIPTRGRRVAPTTAGLGLSWTVYSVKTGRSAS